MSAPAGTPSPVGHIQKHIDLVAQHEQQFLAERSAVDKLADRIASFAGSLPFVLFHICFFLGWIALNTLHVWQLPHFDPPPFSLLATLVALEAILLASFILMRQSRMSRRADERDHLMLQILLLVEKETTAVLGMDRKIATELGLGRAANTPEARELSQQISIEEVAQTIKEALPPGD